MELTRLYSQLIYFLSDHSIVLKFSLCQIVNFSISNSKKASSGSNGNSSTWQTISQLIIFAIFSGELLNQQVLFIKQRECLTYIEYLVFVLISKKDSLVIRSNFPFIFLMSCFYLSSTCLVHFFPLLAAFMILGICCQACFSRQTRPTPTTLQPCQQKRE